MLKALISTDHIDSATLESWPPRERASLFGWTLQASGGQSRRINSIWPTEWTDEVDLDYAISEAESWLRDRGLTPCFRIAEALSNPPNLAAALKARGYKPGAPTFVMVRGLFSGTSADDVELLSSPDEAFFAPLGERASLADFEERRAALLRMPLPRIFARTRSSAGETNAAGACVIVGQMAVIHAMRTISTARRQGLARRILDALIAWSLSQDIHLICLQVGQDNVPALALYGSAGFETMYHYDYWLAG